MTKYNRVSAIIFFSKTRIELTVKFVFSFYEFAIEKYSGEQNEKGNSLKKFWNFVVNVVEHFLPARLQLLLRLGEGRHHLLDDKNENVEVILYSRKIV